MWETIKANPWKTFLGTITTIIVSVVGFWFTDSRYVHVSDMESTYNEIRDLRQQVEQLKQK